MHAKNPTVQPNQPSPAALLRGERVALVGSFLCARPSELRRRIRAAGGEPQALPNRHTTVLLIGERGLPLTVDGRLPRALRRLKDAPASGPLPRLLGERDALEALGLSARREEFERLISTTELAAQLGLPLIAGRSKPAGLLPEAQPGRVRACHVAAVLALAARLHGGATIGQLRTALSELREVLPDLAEAGLHILHRLERLDSDMIAQLALRGSARDGQLWLGFELPAAPEPVVLRLTPPQRSAAEWLEYAQRMEEDDRLDDAADGYRQAIAQEAPNPVAFYNLGTVLAAAGREEAAMELYRLALACDPSMAQAWYNLADILDSHGRLEEAVAALCSALAAEPDFADAHFNLALCLEKLGRNAAASEHWRTYVRLDPGSPWAASAWSHLREEHRE